MTCWVQRGLAGMEFRAGCREAVNCRNPAEGGIENCLQHAVGGCWQIPLLYKEAEVRQRKASKLVGHRAWS